MIGCKVVTMETRQSQNHWPRAGVSAAIFRGASVLLVKRVKPPFAGLWSLPGGHIEAGERAAGAALRELAEETGVVALLGGLAEVVDAIHAPGGELVAHYVIAVYHGTWLKGEPAAASDAGGAMFVPLDEVVGLAATTGLADVVAKAWRLSQGMRDQIE
jgi:8-oxo-dGTP diphosphatase